MRRPKKSKYKSVVINKKRYYYYKITWIDPTGDSGHATAHDSLGLIPSTMITHAYVFFKNKKNVSRAEYIYRKPSKINAYSIVPRCAIPLGTPISQ